jgi:hypothetical protein
VRPLIPPAERTLDGIEVRHTLWKEQVKKLDGRDVVGQAKFVASQRQTGLEARPYESIETYCRLIWDSVA